MKVQAIRYYSRYLECALRTFLPIIKPDLMHTFKEIVDFSLDEVAERDLEDEENEEIENSETVESSSDEDENENDYSIDI